jgi:DNA-binding transcriptional MerR regulator
MYTATQVAQVFNVSRETARRWANEFAAFLSPTANPEQNRQRSFSDSDMGVFALIAEMKAQGRLFEDIRAALGSGQRGSAPANASALALTDQPPAKALQARVLDLEKQLASTSGENRLLKEQLADAQAEIKALNREIGRLEARKDSE